MLRTHLGSERWKNVKNIPKFYLHDVGLSVRMKIGYSRRITIPNIKAGSALEREKWHREFQLAILQSPDANPIENVWSFIKRKLRGKPTLTSKHLVNEIRRKVFATWICYFFSRKLASEMPVYYRRKWRFLINVIAF